MNRFGNTPLAAINNIVEETTPLNTKKTQACIYNQFLKFCEEKNYKLDADTYMQQICIILTNWGYNMKKSDGSDYKEAVVKTMWNVVAKNVQEMYCKKYNVIFNPFTDILFKPARDARNAKRRQLQSCPEKRKASSVALTKEEYKKVIKIWDENTPLGLQRKCYHIIALELAWRGGEAARCLVQHFKQELDNSGKPTGRVEYNTVFSKTAQGGEKKLMESKWLTSNYTNLDECPVRLLNKLLSKRSAHITTDRLFLTVNPSRYKNNLTSWYKNSPVGINIISKWMKEAATKIGLDVANIKITNHSTRATAVSQLAKAGVQEQQLLKMSGHGSAASIKPYLQLDAEHHTKIIQQMRLEVPTSSSTVPESEKENRNYNVYYNCHFSCNNFQCSNI